MRQKKTFKYYLFIFGIAVFAILMFTVVDWVRDGALDLSLLWGALIIPVFFTILLFVFDKVFDFVFKKRKKTEQVKDDFALFIKLANDALDKEGNFSIQDYRDLQDSVRFQKTIKQLHTIKNNGESEDLTIDYLSRKFKKSTIEYQAVHIIIQELKKMD